MRAGVMPNARGRSLRLVFELVELMSTLRCTCSGLCNPHARACARVHHRGCHTIAIASDVDKFKVCNELWHAHVWAALQELTAFKGRTGISLVPVFTPERPVPMSCSASACEQQQLAVCVVVDSGTDVAARAAPPWPGVGAAGAAHVHAGSTCTDLLVDTARTATASVFDNALKLVPKREHRRTHPEGNKIFSRPINHSHHIHRNKMPRLLPAMPALCSPSAAAT